MVFDASEALTRFGKSHTTVVLWQNYDVSHRQMFDTLSDAIAFLRSNEKSPTSAELHIHRGGHDVLIKGDELARLVAEYRSRAE